MDRHRLEEHNDRLQRHLAIGFCIGVSGQLINGVVDAIGLGGVPAHVGSVVALLGWGWVVVTFVRMARLSRGNIAFVDAMVRDERTAVARARAYETGFVTMLSAAVVLMVVGDLVESLSASFVASLLVGLGLAATLVRFVRENR
jgi:hypothetical protein